MNITDYIAEVISKLEDDMSNGVVGRDTARGFRDTLVKTALNERKVAWDYEGITNGEVISKLREMYDNYEVSEHALDIVVEMIEIIEDKTGVEEIRYTIENIATLTAFTGDDVSLARLLIYRATEKIVDSRVNL